MMMKTMYTNIDILLEGISRISDLEKILRVIEELGGEIYVVGGPVRDMVLGLEFKDIDFIVRHLSLDEIELCISKIGKSNKVGASFGIVKGIIGGSEYDFAIPRVKEYNTGIGHSDFRVELDPSGSLQSDLGRRDFTWNSMVVPLFKFIELLVEEKSVSSNKLCEFLRNNKQYDPYGGLESLLGGKIETVGSSDLRFREDPLRMLRALQFCVRFGLEIVGETSVSIRKLRFLLKSISGERILGEFIKGWQKSKTDTSYFIKLLMDFGIGKELFGSDFSPISLRLRDMTDNERLRCNFVAFFLNGGNWELLNPSVELRELLLSGKWLRENKKDLIFSKLSRIKDSGQLVYLKKVFSQVDTEVSEILHKLEKTEVSLKELEISGDDLIILGIKGKEIGIVIEQIISAIWSGSITNNRELILSYIKEMR